MGQLVYAGGAAVVEIEDRALAHLRSVIIAKLRRGESMSFTWESSATGRAATTTLWIHPAMSLRFDFAGNREPAINRTWLETLMTLANTTAGLRLTPEPAPGV